MFGVEPSFLTESLRSASSKDGDSPRTPKKKSQEKKGFGGLFDEDEESGGDLFSESVRSR